MNKIFINRRVFNKSGERLAIYGKIVDLWEMEITVIKCNIEDRFEKKIADKLYNEGKGLKYIIELDSLNHPGKSFNLYCKDTFYFEPIGFTFAIDLSGLENTKNVKFLHSKKDRKIIIKY